MISKMITTRMYDVLAGNKAEGRWSQHHKEIKLDSVR